MRKDKKSLAETHPEVAKQWHPTKNGDLTPYDVTKGMNKKVWWKCDKGDDHEWKASPNKRALVGRGCPICSNQMVVLSNCLSTIHPEIAKEWHPTKNGNITPYNIVSGSNKKFWWKCDKGDDHEWEVSSNARTGKRKTGCPICSNQMVVLSNCLSTTHPEIAKEWHPTKNGKTTTYDIVSGSNKNFWWKCDKGDDHEWKASPSNRSIHSSNCPVCSNQKVVQSNSLAKTHPYLAKRWHPTLNGDLTPEKVVRGSGRRVWWKCDKGDDHEWKAVISSTHKNTCPICDNKKIVLSNCLATTNPKLAKEWHPIKNGSLTPYEIGEGSGRKVWWKCDKGEDHEWKTPPSQRNKSGCPICANQMVVLSNCLSTTHPEIAKEWHPTKNGKTTAYDIVSGSNKKFWWKCNKGDDHEWKASASNRKLHNSNCPICSNHKVVLSNCLATTNPEMLEKWHPSKNGNLTPFDITKGSAKRVWWKCDKGDDHEWSAIVVITEKNTCPICSNLKVVLSNCLATTNSKLSKEWHPTKNGSLTPYKIGEGSGKKVWWKCNKGDDHEWRVSIDNRKYTGCPFCTLTPQSKQELTITFELMKLFKNINPKGLKTKLEGKLRAIDIYIPKLNLCIEFDGSYWHKDKRDIDKIKSEMLFEEGFKLIRVREEPLKKIYDTDVISKQPYNGKQVTNDILSMILSIFELDAKLVSKIKAYQSKDDLQNEKGLEKYIDKILTEKTK